MPQTADLNKIKPLHSHDTTKTSQQAAVTIHTNPTPQAFVKINPKPPVVETQKASPHYRSTSIKALGKEKDMKPISLFNSQLKEAKNDFSQDDLTKHWIEYANSLTIEKIHLKNTLISCIPILKENYSFEISVYNPSQKDELSDNNTHILGYLSNKLNNHHLKMDIRLVEKEEIEMIYTAIEKYDYLSKKNPNIERLKELFNLTVE